MRDKFVRELKKVKGGKSGDAGPAYSPSWPLFDVLQFLTDTVKHRKLVVVFMVEQYFIVFYLYRSHTNLSTPEVDETAPEIEETALEETALEETAMEETAPQTESQDMDDSDLEER